MTDTRDDLPSLDRNIVGRFRSDFKNGTGLCDEEDHAVILAALEALTAPSTPPGDGMVEVVQADRSSLATVNRLQREYVGIDLPLLFEDWWELSPHKNREPYDYGVKKILAFEAFCGGLDTHRQQGLLAPAPIEARELLAQELGWASLPEARKWIANVERGIFNKDGSRVDLAVALRAITRALQGSAGVGDIPALHSAVTILREAKADCEADEVQRALDRAIASQADRLAQGEKG